MVEPRQPETSGGGLGLPSAVNLPVPPPPPPPSATESPPSAPQEQVSEVVDPARVTTAAPTDQALTPHPHQDSVDTPATEAHAFLMAYGPTLLGEAIKRILDACFAVATLPDVGEAIQEDVSSVQPQSAALMVAMILLGSGVVLCQTAKGRITDTDVVFLFDSTQPILTIAGMENEMPSLSASPSQKRRFLRDAHQNTAVNLG